MKKCQSRNARNDSDDQHVLGIVGRPNWRLQIRFIFVLAQMGLAKHSATLFSRQTEAISAIDRLYALI